MTRRSKHSKNVKAGIKAPARQRLLAWLASLQHSRLGLSGLVVAVVAGAVILAALSAWAVLLATGQSQSASNGQSTAQAAAAGLVLTDSLRLPARELMSGQLLDGQTGLVLTVTVTNHTSFNQPFIPVHQTFVRDGLGRTYPLTPLAEATKPIVAGSLRPGESRSGQLSYVVNSDALKAGHMRFYFDSRWSSAPPVVIDL